jgi:hypothetical protein
MITNALSFLSVISISYITFTLVILWALWVLYVAMMNVDRSMISQELPWQAKILVYPTKVLFDIVEVVSNTFICTLIFLDFPREFTVSDRLRRYYTDKTTSNWRLTIVHFVKPMLDPFDHKGPHI